ncbi:type I restriction enzyme S subunit [Nocardiopsis sp. Huas11]|uniref:restriction endonuclease subunit S n=1 Tax=Nocardiopsis sp. Huas11 TaxID=2183912 RepID=UPI000EAEDD77|nr:restriction endonuclease subunit S [Nocardiopsis sp. Huas11]RKS10268.1 type I restriction enzyme S subunit [Nocardiopsis sp. Huas11]
MTEELPEGWVWAKIGDVCEVNPRRFDEPPEEDDLLSFVPMASVEAETGRLDASQTKTYGEVKRKSLTPFQENDVIFSKITPCMENGKIALAEKLHGGRAVGSTEFMVLRCGLNLNPKYLMYFLLQSSFRKEAERNMAGAVGQRRVPRAFISDTDIPVPPLGEQKRIVFELEGKFEFLDFAVKSSKETNKKTGLLFSGILSSLASGSLEGRSGSQGSLESLAKIDVSQSKKVDCSDLPLLPEGWFWRRASELCDSVSSGSTPKSDLMQRGSGDVPFLKVYNLTQSGVVDFSMKPTFIESSTHAKMARSTVWSGDVLTNIVGPPLGKTVVVPQGFPESNINQAIVRFRVGDEVLSEWMYLALRSEFVFSRLRRTSRATSGQWNISLSACREVPIPVPPIEEQEKLLEKFRAIESKWLHAREMLGKVLRRSENLRRALLAAAFTGKLVPQSSTDEPASELLSRIRAEHAAVPKPKLGRKEKISRGAKSPVPITEYSRPIPDGEQTALEF